MMEYTLTLHAYTVGAFPLISRVILVCLARQLQCGCAARLLRRRARMGCADGAETLGSNTTGCLARPMQVVERLECQTQG